MLVQLQVRTVDNTFDKNFHKKLGIQHIIWQLELETLEIVKLSCESLEVKDPSTLRDI